MARARREPKVEWNPTPFIAELQASIHIAIDDVGRGVSDTAQDFVPVDTGTLESTIKYYRSKYQSPTGVGSIVYAGKKGKARFVSQYRGGRRKYPDDAYYAFWVEVGHRVRRKGVPRRERGSDRGVVGRVPAQRYLRRALDYRAPALLGAMQRLGLSVTGGKMGGKSL